MKALVVGEIEKIINLENGIYVKSRYVWIIKQLIMPVSRYHAPVQSCFGFAGNLLEGCRLYQPHLSFFFFGPASRWDEPVLQLEVEALMCLGYKPPNRQGWVLQIFRCEVPEEPLPVVKS